MAEIYLAAANRLFKQTEPAFYNLSHVHFPSVKNASIMSKLAEYAKG
jgi:hypothetical protein